MPELGRFGQVDPVTETQENQSTYHYGWGNPVLNSDPNGEFCIPCIVFIGAMLMTSAQPAMAPAGGKNAKKEQIAYKQAYNEAGMDVLTAVAPGAKQIKATVVVGAVVKRELKQEIKEQASKAAGKLAQKLDKPANKNSNKAEGNFVLYKVKDKDGKPIKVGKADADRTNAVGDPKRMMDSERKAKKEYPGAEASQIPNSNQKTTGAAKEAEAAAVRQERASGNPLPLNKERDKRYNNN